MMMNEMGKNASDREIVRLPPIPHKSKSFTNTSSTVSSLDLVAAKSWYYCTPNAQYGFKSNVKRSIASLTKIMTALCAIQLCQKFNMDLKITYFKVTGWSAATTGTTANLEENSWLNVQDLLYGLMLPSGNDAAAVLAENIGAVLYFFKKGDASLISEIKSIDVTQDYESVRFYTEHFITYMNSRAQQLQMFKTRFANAHGLDNFNSYSCCEDVYLMSKEAMKHKLFRTIVSTITHKALFKFHKDGRVISKSIYWTNTNKLLDKEGVIGVKTGITNKAGGCLSTCFIIDRHSEGFVVVLGCSSAQERFNSTLQIMKWASTEAPYS